MRGKGIQVLKLRRTLTLPIAFRCFRDAQPGMTKWEGKEYVVADGDVMHFRFNN